MSDAARRTLVSLALVGVAAVWGATFVMVKDAVSSYPVYSFLGVRFAIATVAFAVLFPSTFRRMDAGTLRDGLFAGVFLTAGYVFQTLGLAKTSPSKAAFITGMFVVITPFMQAVFLRRMPRWPAWLGVATAVGGLWLLSGGGSLGGWNLGDTLVLLCAVAYSGHIIVLGSLGRRHDARPFAFVQLAMAAIVCGAVGAITEHPGLPTGREVWIALAITGIVASAVAFAVQTYAQRHLSPTRTALILITEPAFGGLFGWLLAGELLGVRGWAGAGLILVGMVVSEVLAAAVARRDERTVLEPSLEGPPAQVLEASE
ncbi:MAG TPA: DMT family transporter [Coriobacteriia bacterium]